jgi:hypothetical protein
MDTFMSASYLGADLGGLVAGVADQPTAVVCRVGIQRDAHIDAALVDHHSTPVSSALSALLLAVLTGQRVMDHVSLLQ